MLGTSRKKKKKKDKRGDTFKWARWSRGKFFPPRVDLKHSSYTVTTLEFGLSEGIERG